MSQRHHTQEAAPPPKMDLRAHAHNERHRINSELQAVASQVSNGSEPEDVHEPGRAWVPEHRRDAAKGKASAMKSVPRHWKMKEWKRRTTVRKAKAVVTRMVAEQA
ncbi:unannotated protein [freshwater metagenome]|uniref:Unannotated protein n=1 Tax=freshwater metagenome TaxID=449393 RepID=A0A6J7DEW0_9ZZZZ|nr:hypothetical protein [Actinomycetota bacterium]